MHIAICDENSEESEVLGEYLKQYFSQKSISFEIMTFIKSADLIYEIEDGKSFDIIFTPFDSSFT